MINKELIARSPLRILEKSTQGGAKQGNISMIAARKGTGKTACLVHIATDQLIQGKNLIHVSFAANTSHIASWYDSIFSEIARRNNVSNAAEIQDQLTKNRVIMNFKQDGVTVNQVISSVKSMIKDGGFNANVVIIDGYDFKRANKDEFAGFKKFAEELQIQLWFSATTHRDDPAKDEKGVPMILSPFMDSIAILIVMEPSDGFVHLNLVKDHDKYPPRDSLRLRLDPEDMLLIAKEK